MRHPSNSQIEATASHSVAASIPRENVLRYSIVRQILSGRVGGTEIGPFRAPSGAGQDGVHDVSLKYKDWNPNKKKTGVGVGQRGGAIMPGWWIVLPEKLNRGQQSSHVKFGAAPTSNSLRVVPYILDASAPGERNSFYIHGTGGHGSDGCILLAPSHRASLVDAICKTGGAWLHAFVSGIELKDALDRSHNLNNTA